MIRSPNDSIFDPLPFASTSSASSKSSVSPTAWRLQPRWLTRSLAHQARSELGRTSTRRERQQPGNGHAAMATPRETARRAHSYAICRTQVCRLTTDGLVPTVLFEHQGKRGHGATDDWTGRERPYPDGHRHLRQLLEDHHGQEDSGGGNRPAVGHRRDVGTHHHGARHHLVSRPPRQGLSETSRPGRRSTSSGSEGDVPGRRLRSGRRTEDAKWQESMRPTGAHVTCAWLSGEPVARLGMVSQGLPGRLPRRVAAIGRRLSARPTP
jgi:hypothetical protein